MLFHVKLEKTWDCNLSWINAEFQSVSAGLWSEPGVYQETLGTWVLVPGDLIAAEALCEWKCLGGVCEGKARRMSGCGEAP